MYHILRVFCYLMSYFYSHIFQIWLTKFRKLFLNSFIFLKSFLGFYFHSIIISGRLFIGFRRLVNRKLGELDNLGFKKLEEDYHPLAGSWKGLGLGRLGKRRLSLWKVWKAKNFPIFRGFWFSNQGDIPGDFH